MTAVRHRQSRRDHVDEILVPDPGPEYLPGDRWYRTVTDERALEAARRRHERELRDRYRTAVDWADYSVRDLRLPMTHRQTTATASALMLCVVAALAGVVLSSTVVLAVSTAVSTGLTAVVVRDVYRRVSLWLLEQ